METFFWSEIRANLGDMDLDAFRELLEKQINNDDETLSDSSVVPDSFTPNLEYTQQVFNVLYGDRRWISVFNKLYYWDVNHYKHSPDVVEKRRIAEFLNALPKTDKNGQIVYPYAKPNCVNNALEWLKMRVGVKPELVNPPGLNCTNGVLQIIWIESKPLWELIPHDPSQYYLYEPVLTYDPTADGTYCDRLLSALDPGQLTIFLRSVAASLDIMTVRKYKGRLVRALLLKGLGSNGKDSIREVVRLMYGGVGMTGCTVSDFRQYDDGRKFPLSKLGRSRVNWASENANFAKIDSLQSLKAAITGDSLDIEKKGKDELEFNPTAVLFFNCNDSPRITGTMEAIASRYAVLTFNKTFKINADPTKGELEADPRFKYDPDFLKTHVLPAFLNRVLAELTNLMREGIDYSPCDRAWDDIKAENSHLFQFCQDVRLNYVENAEMGVGDIWELLEKWYLKNGYLSYTETANGKRSSMWIDSPIKGDRLVKGANQVTARILELFPKAKRVVLPNNARVIRGVGIIDSPGPSNPFGTNPPGDNSPPANPSGNSNPGFNSSPDKNFTPNLSGRNDGGSNPNINQLQGRSQNLEVSPNNQSNPPNQWETAIESTVEAIAETQNNNVIVTGSQSVNESGQAGSIGSALSPKNPSREEIESSKRDEVAGDNNTEAGYGSAQSKKNHQASSGDGVGSNWLPEKFKVGEVVRYVGKNPNYRHEYGNRDLTVFKINNRGFGGIMYTLKGGKDLVTTWLDEKDLEAVKI